MCLFKIIDTQQFINAFKIHTFQLLIFHTEYNSFVLQNYISYYITYHIDYEQLTKYIRTGFEIQICYSRGMNRTYY